MKKILIALVCLPLFIAAPAFAEDSPLPEWTQREGKEVDGTLQFPVLVTLLHDTENGEDSFREEIRDAVFAYLDAHVLKHTKASQIQELTPSYIEHWIAPNHSHESTVELGSGSYQQIWRMIKIDSRERKKLERWDRLQITKDREIKVGRLAGVSLLGMLIASGAIGALAKRERSKRKVVA